MRVGVIGGGQLGRMLALAGYPLGISLRVLDPNPESPAAPLTDFICGGYDDEEALRRFSIGLTCVTFEFENVPASTLSRLEAALPTYPPAEALRCSQDRKLEKELFASLGIETARWYVIDSPTDLEVAAKEIGFPAVLKTRRLGYDGKGQVVVDSLAALLSGAKALGEKGLILESFVKFEREISIIAVRGVDGLVKFYSPVENAHREGILRISKAPAPQFSPEPNQRAQEMCRAIFDRLQYVGVFALEMFQRGNELLANEMAPRVHNPGHWTIEGAVTSQFENHLRAVCGLPLGDTSARGHSAMVNLIGSHPPAEMLLKIPKAHVHLYGKAPRPARKLGHLTFCEATEEARDGGLRVALAASVSE